MKRDWISSFAAVLLGTIFGSIGLAALFHGVAKSGTVLTAAGLFLLLSGYHHAGFTIKNPVVKRSAQVFLFIVVGCAFLVAVTAGSAIATQTGVWAFKRMIESVQEHFWLTSALLLSLCWLFIFRQPKPKL